MGIRIQERQDYSYLFSGLNTASKNSSGSLSFLTDYALIKSGSYGKLMKAYYAEKGNRSESKQIMKQTGTNALSKDDAKTLTKVKGATDSLKDSADKLLAKGSKSLFEQEDAEQIYSAVDEFVKDYNSVLDTMDSVNSTSILGRAKNMVQNTAVNSKLLEKVGITINENNSLSLDKETFLKADVNSVKNLFNGNGSFAYRVSVHSSMMNYAAEQESEKAATYTSAGAFGNTYNSGSLFDSLL